MTEYANILKQKNTSGNTQNRNQPFFFQPKPALPAGMLSINQPNDIYEREANSVADKIMQMEAPLLSPQRGEETFFKPPDSSLSFGEGWGEAIQRKCAECEEEEKNMQRKESNSNAATSSYKTENYISSVSGGKTLGNEEKTFFESRMGYDFSNVRIHTDSNANQSAKNINALAYTHGNNIVFGQGQYQPDTDEGKKLLAHELTHVIQQSSNDVSMKQAPEMIQRAMDKDPSELDDDQLKSEYEAYNEYVHNIDPADYTAEEDNMSYFLALEKELKKRCLKSNPSHPKEVSKKLIDRITGKYASIDGDPGEGLFLTPYVASEGQCTIGYGHVIFPKSSCTINTETTDDGKTKKTCACAPPWNAITKDRAIEILKQDIQKHIKEVDSKIKVDLNQAEFDAMVDLSAHVGSVPSDFANYVNENWCTNKDAVRERYLKTAIKMKDPDTKQYKVMKNFVERRKKRAW